MTSLVKKAVTAACRVVVVACLLGLCLTAAAQTRTITTIYVSQPAIRSATRPAYNSASTTRAQPQPPKADTRTLTFDATCAPGRRAVIAAVGDLLFHDALQEQALRPGHDFRAFWSPVAEVLKSADLTYGNLESPIAAGVGVGGLARKDPGRVLDRVVYGRLANELVFNTHPSVAADLAASGFDVISTANNHSADRGSLGMDRTLDALDAAGLAHTGMRRASDTTSPWSARTRTRNGLSIAWLACTYSLNGLPDPRAQVRQCYRDLDAIKAELTVLASDPDIDAVILTPHWGIESAPAPQASERGLARLAIDAGATAVIGTHPHVVQPWEKYTTASGREGLIIYSTGNFISNQKSDDQRTGMIALLEITRPNPAGPDAGPGAGRARLSAAGYIATYVLMTGSTGHRVTELVAANDSTRRLPAGNRVSMARFRDLPRACDPTKVQPPAVAAASTLPSVHAALPGRNGNEPTAPPRDETVVVPSPELALPREAPALLRLALSPVARLPEPMPPSTAGLKAFAETEATPDARVETLPPIGEATVLRALDAPAAEPLRQSGAQPVPPPSLMLTVSDDVVATRAADRRPPPPKRQPPSRPDPLVPARVQRLDA